MTPASALPAALDATPGDRDGTDVRRLDRFVRFEQLANFRDLGGYAGADGRTVRRRHLFRSDALWRLTGADVERVHALGVTTVIDFRTSHELEANGWGGIELLALLVGFRREEFEADRRHRGKLECLDWRVYISLSRWSDI